MVVQRAYRETQAAEEVVQDRVVAVGPIAWPGWENIQTTPAIKLVEFIVCGDPARNKVQPLAGGPGNAIKEIKLPAKWDELMEKAGYRPLREFHLK